MPDKGIDPEDVVEVQPSYWDEKSLLQKIVSIAPNILYVFNQQTKTNEFINNSLESSMGYTAEEIGAMGADFMPMVCHPEDLPKVFQHFQKFHVLKDGDIAHVEYRMKHKDGQWRWMLSHDAVFDRDENGEVRRLIGVATDITERKAAEDRAIAQQRTADAATEELRNFAYSISHDLKSPTNSLHMLMSELVSQHESQLQGEARELVDLSLEMIQKMQSLVEDVLGYTRIIGSEAVFEEVSLSQLVGEVLQSLNGEIKQAGARIVVDDLPNVLGSVIQLRSYFQNMIGNALKYRQPGRDIEVQLRNVTGPVDERVSIAVIDNGIGIAPSDWQRIFGMFKRLHLEEEISGTGLGLALCQRVAVNHGGRIRLASALGEGSTFTLDLARA